MQKAIIVWDLLKNKNAESNYSYNLLKNRNAERLVPQASSRPVGSPSLHLASLSMASDESVSVQDPLWGTNTFDGCMLCRRGREACRMISDRHHECLSCRTYIRKHQPQNVSGLSKQRYIKGLTKEPGKYDEHVTGVLESESSKSGSAGQAGAKTTPVKRKRVQCGGSTVDLEDESPMLKLMKMQGRSLEVRVYASMIIYAFQFLPMYTYLRYTPVTNTHGHIYIYI